MAQYLRLQFLRRSSILTDPVGACPPPGMWQQQISINWNTTESPLLYDHHSTQFQPNPVIWRDFHAWFNRDLPGSTRRWLLDEGSLTQHLVRSSGNRFAVQVLRQRWTRAPLSDTTFLEIPNREICLVREVTLLCTGEPVVYARSVLPACSLVGPLRHLRNFDNRSLGQLLFNTPGMQRSPFQLARLEGASLPVNKNITRNQRLWGRRSRFTLHGKPLLVSEIFLPAFTPWD